MKSVYHSPGREATAWLQCGRGGWIVTMLLVSSCFRGRGFASKVLAAVCADADREGVRLALRPLPLGEDGLTQEALRVWYGRAGFRGTDVMVREAA